MINKNKLSLKILQKELEDLKATKAKNNNKTITPSGVVNPSTAKSSFSLIFIMSLISGALIILRKLPFINRLVSVLQVMYGRTTIWKLLVLLRKAFIVINAIVGVWTVFNITGFSTDNIIAGFTGMGYSYIEILLNLVRRLFNWFFDLFDYKIVPNVPSGAGKVPGVLSPEDLKNIHWSGVDWKRAHDAGLETLPIRREYVSPLVIKDSPSTTYLTWSNLYWIAGGIATVVGVVGLWYLGSAAYSYCYPAEQVADASNIAPQQPAGDGPSQGILPGIYGGISSMYNRTTSALNPMNWYSYINRNLFLDATPQQQAAFMTNQSDFARQNRAWYPFTVINPMDSWWSKMKLAIFGESLQSYNERMENLRSANIFYDSTIRVQALNPGVQPLTSTAVSGISTPGALGLNLNLEPISALELARSLETQRMIAQSPNVPTTDPLWAGTLEGGEASTSTLPEVRVTPGSPVQSDGVSEHAESVREEWSKEAMSYACVATKDYDGVSVAPGSTAQWYKTIGKLKTK